MTIKFECTYVLENIYDLERCGEPRQASRTLIMLLLDLSKAGRFTDINELMKTIDMDRLNSRALTSLMRVTFTHRDKLSSWEESYRKAWNRAHALDRPPEDLFVGLGPPLRIWLE